MNAQKLQAILLTIQSKRKKGYRTGRNPPTTKFDSVPFHQLLLPSIMQEQLLAIINSLLRQVGMENKVFS